MAILSHIPGTKSYTERIISKARAEIEGQVRSDANDFLSKLIHNDLARSFESASASRNKDNWDSLALFNADFSRILPTLRHRSRLLSLEDATAHGMINKDISNVIGPGFRAEAVIPKNMALEFGIDPDGDEAKDMIAKVESYWNETVTAGTNFDYQGARTYLQMAQLRYKMFKEDGENFGRYQVESGRGDLPFSCRIIMPESVGTPSGKTEQDGIKSGIQFVDGRLAGYWMAVNMNGAPNHVFVPLNNDLGLPEMRHYFNPIRENCPRGLPWLSTSMLSIHDTNDYLDSELKSKIIEACVALVIQSKSPKDMAAAFEDDPNLSGGLGGSSSGTSNPKISNFPKQSVLYTNTDEEVKTVQWSRPGGGFLDWIRTNFRKTGQGAGRSYESVANDYGAANFSATRVSGIEDDLEYLIEFTLFSQSVLDADWAWAVWGASMKYGDPRLRLMTPGWQKYVKKSWDELRDAKSATERIDNGTSNTTIEASRFGNDIDRVMEGSVSAEKRLDDLRAAAGLDENEGDGDE